MPSKSPRDGQTTTPKTPQDPQKPFPDPPQNPKTTTEGHQQK